MGHNLGLYHSHALECGAATLGSTCSSIEYGDTLDTMGGGQGHYNAFQKERLGWLNYGVSPLVTTATTSGTYSLGLYETSDANPKALKILKSTDPTTGLSTWYYIEYRQPLGFDVFTYGVLNNSISNGVVVHIATDSSPNSSDLLDMTPASSTYYDWYDVALAVGQSFSDPTSSVIITTAWTDGTSAGAGVTLTQPGSVRANPSVSASPTSQSGTAGAALASTVTLLNNDSSSCTTSSFPLTAALPTGWSGAFATQSLSIAPGASASITLTVTSPVGAGASNYTLGIGAANAAATNYTSSTSVSYVVVAGLTVAVATDKASYSAGQTVNMSASVAVGGAALSGASVSFTITKPDRTTISGKSTTGLNGIASYTLKLSRKNPPGTYTVQALATSSGVSGSGTTSFQVQ